MATPEELREMDMEALAIVRRNSLWAMGVGLVPVPIVDVLGVSAVQLKMVRELSHQYHVSFSHNRAKSIIGALLGGIGSVTAAGLMFSALKFIPIIGQTAGAVTLPLTAGAATYATGRVFIQHFASGGTLLDLDPAKMREYFRKEFQDAKATLATKSPM
jgi:uncharacterized protein (DUF697 family)